MTTTPDWQKQMMADAKAAIEKEEARPPAPKFVQIATVSIPDEHSLLYALDETGQVWEFDFSHREWDPISGRRCHD